MLTSLRSLVWKLISANWDDFYTKMFKEGMKVFTHIADVTNAHEEAQKGTDAAKKATAKADYEKAMKGFVKYLVVSIRLPMSGSRTDC